MLKRLLFVILIASMTISCGNGVDINKDALNSATLESWIANTSIIKLVGENGKLPTTLEEFSAIHNDCNYRLKNESENLFWCMGSRHQLDMGSYGRNYVTYWFVKEPLGYSYSINFEDGRRGYPVIKELSKSITEKIGMADTVIVGDNRDIKSFYSSGGGNWLFESRYEEKNSGESIFWQNLTYTPPANN